MNLASCPCGHATSYQHCCGAFISGEQIPTTPEQLMRSRYTAYSRANIDYIASTMKSPASDGFDVVDARKWAQSVRWDKLVVLSSWQEGAKGFVEFIAHFYNGDKLQKIHELSEFHLIDGRWYYVDGRS